MSVFYRRLLPSCPVPDRLKYHWGAKFVCDGKNGCGRVWKLYNDGESYIGWQPLRRCWWREHFCGGYDTHNPHPQGKVT